MAESLGSIWIEIRGDARKLPADFDKAKKSAQQSASELENNINKSQSRILAFTTAMNNQRAREEERLRNSILKSRTSLNQQLLRQESQYSSQSQKNLVSGLMAEEKERASLRSRELAALKADIIERTNIRKKEAEAQRTILNQQIKQAREAQAAMISSMNQKARVGTSYTEADAAAQQYTKTVKRNQAAIMAQRESFLSNAGSMEKVQEVANKMNKRFDGLTETTNKNTKSFSELTLGIFKSAPAFALATAGIAAIYSALRLLRDGFINGLRSVEDFKISISSMAAFLSTFGLAKGGTPELAFKNARIEAEKLVEKLEILDAKSIATGKDLRIIAEQFIKGGVAINLQNKEVERGFLNISNALKLLTQGQNQEIQLRQEVRALITGQVKDSNILVQTLKSIDPSIKEHIKLWAEEGTVIQNVGALLSGFDQASKDLQNTWAITGTTMSTIFERILRAGFKDFFESLIKTAQDFNRVFIDLDGNLTPVAIGLEKLIAASLKMVEIGPKIAKAFLPGLQEGLYVIGKLTNAVNGYNEVLDENKKQIQELLDLQERFNKRLATAKELNERIMQGEMIGELPEFVKQIKEVDKIISPLMTSSQREISLFNDKSREAAIKFDVTVGELSKKFDELYEKSGKRAVIKIEINEAKQKLIELAKQLDKLELQKKSKELAEKTAKDILAAKNKFEEFKRSLELKNGDEIESKYNKLRDTLAGIIKDSKGAITPDQYIPIFQEIGNLENQEKSIKYIKEYQNELKSSSTEQDKLNKAAKEYDKIVSDSLPDYQKGLENINRTYDEQIKKIEILGWKIGKSKEDRILAEKEVEKARDKALKDYEFTQNKVTDSVKVLSDTLKDQLTDTIFSLKDGFEGLYKLIDNIFTMIVKRMIEVNITQPIVDVISGRTTVSGGGGGWFGQALGLASTAFSLFGGVGGDSFASGPLATTPTAGPVNTTFGQALSGYNANMVPSFPSAHGNAFLNGSIMAFANGGIIDRPMMFGMKNGGVGLAGEAGTEAILPLKRNTSGDLGVVVSDNKSTNNYEHKTNINVYVQSGTPGEVRRSAGQGAREALSILQRAQRYS